MVKKKIRKELFEQRGTAIEQPEFEIPQTKPLTPEQEALERSGFPVERKPFIDLPKQEQLKDQPKKPQVEILKVEVRN